MKRAGKDDHFCFCTTSISEIDISVSKLLGFESFAKSLRVSVSVSENLVSEKKSRFRFRKNLVSEKSLGLGFGKFGLGKEQIVFVIVCFRSQRKCPHLNAFAECLLLNNVI